MKSSLSGALATLGVLAVAVVAIAFLKPDLLPPWARPGAMASATDSGPFCDEHGVPEKFCTICHPDLKGKLLLCPEHGNIPEDVCTLCHPDVKEKYGLKTCEHGLPEHFCPKCKAEKGGDEASADLVDDGWCVAFGEKAPDGSKTCERLPLVRLASADLAKDVGFKTAPVVEVKHVHELFAIAETAYDANRYAEIHPRVAGFLREARPDLGGRMEEGDVVAVVDSAEVSAAKAQYITSHSAYQLAKDVYGRTGALNASKVIADAKLVADRSAMNQAEATLLNAEQRLRNFRFDDEDLARILKDKDTRPLLDVTTPLAGTVVFRHAVLGEAVEPNTKLYSVADSSTMWLWIQVYERDVRQVEPGQKVSFAVMGAGPEDAKAAFEGKITWVGAEVDETTRTTKVRAEIPNPGGRLRANQFGKARIELGDSHMALTVAKAAVQRYENADLVFLTDKPGVFRPQRIKVRQLGKADVLEVSWGLKAGQEVVTAGSYLLKTEIMKGSIGAGCCE